MQHTPRKLSNMSNPEYMYPDHPLAAIVAERNSEQSATQLLNLLKKGSKPASAAKLQELRIHLIQSTWRRVVARKRGNQ